MSARFRHGLDKRWRCCPEPFGDLTMASAYSVYTQEQRGPAAKPPPSGNGRGARRWLIRGGLTALLVLMLGAGVWGFVSYRHQRLLASLQKDPEKIRDAERAGKISRDE